MSRFIRDDLLIDLQNRQAGVHHYIFGSAGNKWLPFLPVGGLAWKINEEETA